jgi:hypothetical protein
MRQRRRLQAPPPSRRGRLPRLPSRERRRRSGQEGDPMSDRPMHTAASVSLSPAMRAEASTIHHSTGNVQGTVHVHDPEAIGADLWVYGTATQLHRLARACLDAAEMVEAHEARNA